MALPQIPTNAPIVGALGRVSREWLQFFLLLRNVLPPSGSAAPADAAYVLGTANAGLPDALVVTDSASIDFDTATAGQLKAHVIVDPAGALDGGSADPLAVRVDGVTVFINGSNQLEAAAAVSGSWVPLAVGSEPLAFVSDGAGSPILVAYP